MKLIKSFLLLPLLVVSFAAPAMAQRVAVFSEDRVLSESQVGQHVAGRLTEIATEMQTELQAVAAPVQQERERWNAETASMTEEAIQARPDLMQRYNQIVQGMGVIRQAEQYASQEMDQTRAQALRPVQERLNVIIPAILEEQNVDILLERRAVRFAGESVDISDTIIQRLNAELPSVTVSRVRIPREAAPQQAQ
ncbi:OmpH family outer membrane protein [Maricaulis sp. D1M11]|uniref:OmpH family outer membrane protein n=1 Tax=Maricaulis sp. D1M11 TaxID=3076117 RepID=UPI0039B3E627